MKPWFTYSAVDYLELLLNKSMSVFEWGSGSSSIWFSEKCKQVVSIEHNREWFIKTAEMIEADDRKNAAVIHIPAIFTDETKSYSMDSFTSMEHLPGYSFEAYCKAVQSFSADVYCIDGRARLSCLGVLLPKLRPGNIVIWDNSERDHYSPGLDQLEKISIRYDFSGPGEGGSWQTSIFKIK